MKKQGILLLTGLLTMVSIMGCAGSKGSSAKEDKRSASAKESQDLTISWWGNQTRNERTQKVLEMYGNEKGINFDGQFSEWSDYWNKLATASAGHSLPDIVQMDYSYLNQYAGNNLLVDLSPYVEDKTLDLSDVSENILESGKINGKLYAVPMGQNVPAVMYNKTLLEEHKITVKNNMTMEEFYDVCRKVYEKTGYKTDVFYGNGDAYIGYYLRGLGAKLYGEGKIGASEEQLKSFFEIYEKGIKEGWMVDPSVYAERTVGTPEQMPLVYGSGPSDMAWCAFAWSNSLAALQSAAKEGTEIGMITWPSDHPKSSDYVRPSMFLCVTSDSKNPKAAAEFINYWTNNRQANKVLLAERGIPISSKVAEDLMGSLDKPQQEAVAFINDVVIPNSTAIDAPAPQGSAEVIELTDSLVEEVCHGAKTAASAAEEFYKKGNGFLAK